MANRFAVGDLVHNRSTNQDGKVTGLPAGGSNLYKVSVPIGQTGWELGATDANWAEGDLEPSTNELLRLDTRR